MTKVSLANRCASLNREGSPCGMPPLAGSDRCFVHCEERGAERAKARKKGGRQRRAPHGSPPPSAIQSMRSVSALQDQLERALFDSLQLRNSVHRSRTIGYLVGIGLRALEVGELEERLAALEQRLGRASHLRSA